ncbi:uncharacterized protein J3R85_012592 [Psidium guajava]|nr:uncharacterized protein J3R85_012592 [Psidium guajava]
MAIVFLRRHIREQRPVQTPLPFVDTIVNAGPFKASEELGAGAVAHGGAQPLLRHWRRLHHSRGESRRSARPHPNLEPPTIVDFLRQRRRPPPHDEIHQRFFMIGLVTSWYSSNIGVLLLNKYLLSNYGFKYPIFSPCAT